MQSKKPDKEQCDETVHYVKTLKDNKQVSDKPGPLSPGETHREIYDQKAEKRLKRERFSAI